MKKTIKARIMDYVRNSSNHTYIKPKKTFNFNINNASESKYDYNYDETTLFKILSLEDNEIKYLDYDTYRKSYSIIKLDIDSYVNNYGSKSLNVITNIFFKDKKMISVKNNNSIKTEISEILKNIK